MGYSGGGQFALRFLYLHPHRLEAVSIGAPGNITSLDDNTPWPKGIADAGKKFPDVEINLDQIKTVKFIQVIVGAEDDNPTVNKWKAWLATELAGGVHTEKEDNTSGKAAKELTTRLKESTKLHETLKSYGLESTLTLVPNVKHDADACSPWVSSFLEQPIAEFWARCYLRDHQDDEGETSTR